jgi:cytochrome b561
MNAINGFNTVRDRYTRVAMILHWAIAALILFNLLIGFVMEDLPLPQRGLVLMLHASSGLTVLALTVARVAWRLLNTPPPYPSGMKPWERHAAHFAHFLLYAAMLLMPLSGWAILSAHAPPGSAGAVVEWSSPPPGAPVIPGRPPGPPPPLKIWNLIKLPLIAPVEKIAQEPGGLAPQRVLHDEFVEWHSVGAFLLIALLLLHVLGALKHQFIDGQPEFARMGIGRAKSSRKE